MESGRAVLDDALHLESTLGVVADELLELIEDQESTRELAGSRRLEGEDLLDGRDHLVVGDIGSVGELLAQYLAALLRVRGEVGVDREQALHQRRRDVQVAELVRKVTPLLFDPRLHRIVESFAHEPEREASGSIVGGQTRALEENAQEGQPYVATRSGCQHAGC